MVQFTATATAIQNDMYQLNAKGQVVQVKVNPADYDCPDDREYQLKLTGYTDPFEMDGQFGIQEKIRLEWEVQNSKKWGGTRFSNLYTVPKGWGEKAKLAQVVMALTGEPITPGQVIDFDDLLGMSCFGMVKGQMSASTGNVYPTIAAYRPATALPALEPHRRRPRSRRVAVVEDDEPPF